MHAFQKMSQLFAADLPSIWGPWFQKYVETDWALLELSFSLDWKDPCAQARQSLTSVQHRSSRDTIPPNMLSFRTEIAATLVGVGYGSRDKSLAPLAQHKNALKYTLPPLVHPMLRSEVCIILPSSAVLCAWRPQNGENAQLRQPLTVPYSSPSAEREPSLLIPYDSLRHVRAHASSFEGEERDDYVRHSSLRRTTGHGTFAPLLWEMRQTCS